MCGGQGVGKAAVAAAGLVRSANDIGRAARASLLSAVYDDEDRAGSAHVT